MAPNHSSLLSGLSLFWQTTGIIVTQTIIGFIVKNHVSIFYAYPFKFSYHSVNSQKTSRFQDLEEWNMCFLLSTGVLLLSSIIFLEFGSSEPQPWSIIPKPKTKLRNENISSWFLVLQGGQKDEKKPTNIEAHNILLFQFYILGVIHFYAAFHFFSIQHDKCCLLLSHYQNLIGYVHIIALSAVDIILIKRC